MIPTVSIREPRATDIPEITRLMLELWADAPIPEGEEGQRHLSQIMEHMASCPSIYFNRIATCGSRAVGFISAIFYRSFIHRVGTAQLNELVVDIDYRGQGIGQALLEEVIREARLRGMDEVEVSTASDNTKALHFYREAGFTDEYVMLGMDLEEQI